MMNPFVEDGYLIPEVSVNKLRLAMAQAPNDIRGKAALDIISGAVFIERMDSLFTELGIRAYHADRQRRFVELFDDPCGRVKAEALLQKLGKNLGHILLALKHGSGAREEIRPEWTDEQWEYWHKLDVVYLSGGLSYGLIGERLMLAAEELFEHTGRPYTLKLAKNSEYLPLIGAYQRGAREAGSAGVSESIIVLDFGHTYVKRGFVCDGAFTVLDRVESIARYMYDDESEDVSAQLLNDFIIGVILDTCAKASRAGKQGKPSAIASVSIANYINHGGIYPHRGEYGRLSRLPVNYEEYLSRELSRRLGHEFQTILIHDGTAAAYGIDNPAGERAAVITLGTGLGVGFCDMRDWPYKKFQRKKENHV